MNFWNSQDISTAFDVFTEDIVYKDITLGVEFDGATAFLGFAQDVFTAFPQSTSQSTFTLVNSSCSGQQGFIEWSWSALDAPPGFFGTGKQFTVRGVTIIEIHGNRISRDTDYWDYATVLRQLGQLPPGL